MLPRTAKIIISILLSLASAVLLLLPCGAFAAESRDAYSIISDIVYAYKMDQTKAYPEIEQLFAELRALDPALAKAWKEVMDYWIYVNNDLEVNDSVLPDGLPQDDSLCIIVLGFQLEPDGEMAPELLGRCRTALECAKKYPSAYVAVTGGGTAARNPTATEADCMAAWLVNNGVDRERIIVENKSQTTAQNAQFTCKILEEQYPQIRHAAIVTSDYHVPLGCLLFREQFVLSAYKNGTEEIWLSSNAGYRTEGPHLGFQNTVRSQSIDVWSIADILDEIY